MSEEEAKTKWCPFVRAIGANGAVAVSGNAALDVSNKPPTLEHAGFNCIGSACMAWRWGVQHPYGGFIEFAPNPLLAEQFAKREGDGRTVGGFCGLAGRP